MAVILVGRTAISRQCTEMMRPLRTPRGSDTLLLDTQAKTTLPNEHKQPVTGYEAYVSDDYSSLDEINLKVEVNLG